MGSWKHIFTELEKLERYFIWINEVHFLMSDLHYEFNEGVRQMPRILLSAKSNIVKLTFSIVDICTFKGYIRSIKRTAILSVIKKVPIFDHLFSFLILPLWGHTYTTKNDVIFSNRRYPLGLSAIRLFTYADPFSATTTRVTGINFPVWKPMRVSYANLFRNKYFYYWQRWKPYLVLSYYANIKPPRYTIIYMWIF